MAPRYSNEIEKTGRDVYFAPLVKALEEMGKEFEKKEKEVPLQILDLCCGTGEASIFLAKRFPGAEITGVDISPEMIGQAEINVKRLQNEAGSPDNASAYKAGITESRSGSHISFIVENVCRCSFPPGHFDIIVSMNAPFFLTETLHWLKTGGNFVFAWSLAGNSLRKKEVITDIMISSGFENIKIDKEKMGIYGIVMK